MAEVKGMSESELVALNITMMEMQGIAQPILDDCVDEASIDNLTINGQKATIQDIVDEPRLTPLCTAIIGELVVMSQLKENDQKN